MITMRSVSGKVESFPESEVERRKFYGWKILSEFQTSDIKYQISNMRNMTKDEINDWAAEHLPDLRINPSQMKKSEMINIITEAICQAKEV